VLRTVQQAQAAIADLLRQFVRLYAAAPTGDGLRG
jgi:hypothetical protein